MSEDRINEEMIIKYLNKDLDNNGMLQVDRWMALSTKNMKKFNEIRSKWLDRKEQKIREEKANQPRMKARAAKTKSGEKLVPVQTPNKSRAVVIFIAIAIAVIGMVMALLLGGSAE